MQNKKRDIIQLFLAIVIVVLINYISSFVFHRFDLTSEKRYSISEASKEMLKGLDDIVFIRVYLAGELPAGFARLRDATKEMLDEFRAYSNANIEYEFIDPSESPDEKTRLEIYQQLTKQGLQYTNLEYKEGEKVSEKIIFPGAMISFKGKETPVQLLKSQMGAGSEVMLNNSVQQLEYELAGSIRKLSNPVAQKIAFIEGHGELEELEVSDITKSLKENYTVERVKIDGQLSSLKDFDAVIIAKPDSILSEKDKFILDQFLMKGGKLILLVEGTEVSMDSLQAAVTTLATPLSVNLEDMLFKYGVRVNTDLVMDLRALPIPVVTGYVGNQPKQDLFPWYYFPLLIPETKHPVVNNLDALKTHFVSSIDTIGRPFIRKTILLATSRYSRVTNAPTRVSLNVLRDKPDEKQFSKGPQTVAVLLEGEFESVFANRIPPQIEEDREIAFKERSVPTKMIVVSDGDMIRNEVNKTKDKILPLGYDKYTQREYANRDFIMNSVNYLLDKSGLIIARAKEFRLRLLDRQRIEKERLWWQTVNTVFPVALIIIFGVIQNFIRRRKYTSSRRG